MAIIYYHISSLPLRCARLLCELGAGGRAFYEHLAPRVVVTSEPGVRSINDVFFRLVSVSVSLRRQTTTHYAANGDARWTLPPPANCLATKFASNKTVSGCVTAECPKPTAGRSPITTSRFCIHCYGQKGFLLFAL